MVAQDSDNAGLISLQKQQTVFLSIQTGCRARPASWAVGNWSSYSGGKAAVAWSWWRNTIQRWRKESMGLYVRTGNNILSPSTSVSHISIFQIVRFVADEVALGQFCLLYFGSPLWVPLHQCFRLIFIYMLHVPEVWICEAWKPSRKKTSFRKWGMIG